MKKFNRVETRFQQKLRLLQLVQDPTAEGNSSITIHPCILNVDVHRRLPKSIMAFVNYYKRIQGSIYFRALSSTPAEKRVLRRFDKTGTLGPNVPVTKNFESALRMMNGRRRPKYGQKIKIAVVLDKKTQLGDTKSFYEAKTGTRPIVIATIEVSVFRDKNKAFTVMRKADGTKQRG